MPQSSSHKKPSLMEELVSLEVTCVDSKAHDSPHQAIKNIGGSWGVISREKAILRIEKNPFEYFVKNKTGGKVYLEIAHHNGTPYLRTQKDGEELDNLLRLDPCPLNS